MLVPTAKFDVEISDEEEEAEDDSGDDDDDDTGGLAERQVTCPGTVHVRFGRGS